MACTLGGKLEPGAECGHNLGVCILNWNAGEVLVSCVAVVLDALSPFPATLVVVDNNSSDGSTTRLAEAFPEIEIICNQKNLGYAQGNNVGAQELVRRGCEYLLFLNPDVTITRDTVAELLKAMAVNPAAGCAGGRNSAWMSCFRNRPTVLEKLLIYGRLRDIPLFRFALKPFLRHLKRSHYGQSETVRCVYAVWGACLMFRSDAFRQARGFDEHTFLYEEEFIISERLRACGWEVVCAPAAVYGHLGSHCTKQQGLLACRHFIDSEQYLVRSYYGWSRVAAGLLFVYRWLEFVLYSTAHFVLGVCSRVTERATRGVTAARE